MSDQRDDGGPAFPLAALEAIRYAQACEDLGNLRLDGAERTYYGALRAGLGGVTMRDYFAAKALQGLLCRSIDNTTGFAVYAYQLADAMLEARK